MTLTHSQEESYYHQSKLPPTAPPIHHSMLSRAAPRSLAKYGKLRTCSSPSPLSQKSSGLRYDLRRVHAFSTPLVITRSQTYHGGATAHAEGSRKAAAALRSVSSLRNQKGQRERVDPSALISTCRTSIFWVATSCQFAIHRTKPKILGQLRLNVK